MSLIRRDTGIKRSGDRAGEEWKRLARLFLRVYMPSVPFLTEDLREIYRNHGLPAPPDGRAWGVVMQSAKREGLIRAVGYAPAKSSNLSPKVQWVAA